MSKRLFIIVIAAACAMHAHSAAADSEAREMSIKECTSIALSQHPMIVAAQQGVLEAQERVAVRRGAKLPQVAFRTEVQRYDWLPPNKEKLLGGGSSDVYSAMTLSTLLFSSGRAEADIDSASAVMYATMEDLRRARQDVALSVARAYYNSLRAEAVLNARTEAVTQMEQHLKVAQRKYDIGKAAKLDVLRAEVQLADVTQAKLLAANQLDITRLELANAMGLESDSPQVIPLPDEQPSPPLTDSGAYLDEALKINPAYLKSVLLTKSAESEVRSAKADSGPELSLIGSYNREGKDVPDIENWNVGLAVSMPIYTGGITRARVSEAKAVVQQSKANTDLTRQRITLGVRSASLSTQDAANRLTATRKSVEQAREALRVAQEKYDAGLGSSTEVLDTQVALTQAETNYAQALYDGKIAAVQLDYAIGRDPKVNGSAGGGSRE